MELKELNKEIEKIYMLDEIDLVPYTQNELDKWKKEFDLNPEDILEFDNYLFNSGSLSDKTQAKIDAIPSEHDFWEPVSQPVS